MRSSTLVHHLSVAVFLAASVFRIGAQTPAAPAPPLSPPANQAANLQREYGKLPMSFEENQGQADSKVAFLARGAGYGLYLTGAEARIALNAPHNTQGQVIRMRLLNSVSAPPATGLDRLPGTANYLIGDDPTRWKRNIPTFSKVNFSSVYPGIDLAYYGNQGRLEYDFIVSPGAAPNAIRLHFDGTAALSLTSDGDLSLGKAARSIAFRKPDVYQEIDGKRVAVAGRFQLFPGHDVGFSVGAYDHAHALIIDPVLAYSTYLGNSSGATVSGIAVDGAGNAYMTGNTPSAAFPATGGAYQNTDHDQYQQPTAFVSKLNAAGTALIYSTYLGGSGQVFNGQFGGEDTNFSCGSNPNGSGYFNSCGDYGTAIAIDGAGDAYITGYTFSSDFPVSRGAFQSTNKAAPSSPNAFVTKLNPTGTGLLYSTYLGGSGGGYGGGDSATTIAIDKNGDAYVAGFAFSTDYPVTSGAFQTTNSGFDGESAAFVTKINPTATALLYSTYLGGGGYIPFGSYTYGVRTDGANALALDASGDAFVTGVAYNGSSFPVTPGAFQTTDPAPCPGEDCGAPGAFVVKLNPTGDTLLYGTWLVGASGGVTQGNAIAVDGAGSAYVTGLASYDFPVTPGAYQTTGGADFVAKLNPDGSALAYATFLGQDYDLTSIAVDQAGDAVVAGSSRPGFPTTADAYQATGSDNQRDAILAELNPAGSQLLYGTYLGGDGGSRATALALDQKGSVYFAGTAGGGLPATAGALQTTLNAASDGFVAKFTLGSATTSASTKTVLTATANPQPQGMPNTFTATVSAVNTAATPSGSVIFSIDGGSGVTVPLNGNAQASYTTSSLSLGSHTVQAFYQGNTDFSPGSATLNVSVIQTAAPQFTPAPGKYVGSVSVSLTDSTQGATIYYTTDGSNPSTASPVYNKAILINSGYVVVKALAAVNGYAPSSIAPAAYSIVAQTPAPAISPASATYPVGAPITITDADPNATIRYTLDGSAPTTKSLLYLKPFALTTSETVKAIAISTGKANSIESSATYSAVTQPPTFSPLAGKYIGSVSVTLNDVTPPPYAIIHYTLDGSSPSAASPVYQSPIVLSPGYVVIKAIAVVQGYPPTAIAQAAFTVLNQTATPVIMPASGAYAAGQTITITDATPRATIRYTTDGSTPTTTSTLYQGPFALTRSLTVRAIAISTGAAGSPVATASFTVQ